MRRWKPSLFVFFAMYLLAWIRAASSASEEICSSSRETMWIVYGNSPTSALRAPRSYVRIFGSGTPRLKRLFGYGLFLQNR